MGRWFMLGSRQPDVCTCYHQDFPENDLGLICERISTAAVPYAIEYNSVRREILERPTCLFEM